MSLKDKAREVSDEIQKEAEVLKGEESKDKQYKSHKDYGDEAAARHEFAKARERLFQVNDWSNIPGVGNAGFTLYDRSGAKADNRTVEVGDFLKIDLPGPVPFFWVEAIEMKDDTDFAEFTVKPAPDPTKREDREVVDHFFHEGARSTFRVERQGSSLYGMEIGVNEAINNQGEKAGDKKVVNTVVSETGWAFFQKNQWENLTDYLVGKSE